jgi:uncharacterized protein (TIGR00730 family)
MSDTGKQAPPDIPRPPDPKRRREPLPGSHPKAGDEDPHAADRVHVLLEAPSYRRADQDVAFLERDEARGLRLNLEYLKPELLLNELSIKNTIVVFGSTRVSEPVAAQRRIDSLERALAESPDDTDLQRRLRVARHVLDNSRYYMEAREFGRLVGESGEGPLDCDLVVMTGGGPGIMEAANRGAFECGAKTVGLNIDLPHEQYPNSYISEELCFRFRYFALRKLHFMQRARALVAFPGGFGTLDELFEALTLIQTRTIKPLPVVLVGREYWQRVIDFDFLLEAGAIDAEDLDIFWFAETALEAWRGIEHWYLKFGEPLFNGGAET